MKFSAAFPVEVMSLESDWRESSWIEKRSPSVKYRSLIGYGTSGAKDLSTINGGVKVYSE
jgi:hypothetical protein